MSSLASQFLIIANVIGLPRFIVVTPDPGRPPTLYEIPSTIQSALAVFANNSAKSKNHCLIGCFIPHFPFKNGYIPYEFWN
jgi:hypothetical protein